MSGDDMQQQKPVNYDCAAEFYDETRSFPDGVQERISAFIARRAGLDHDTRLLEIGIGTGRMALPLSQYVQEIYGVDISRRMMQRLRSKQAGERVYLAQANGTRLPFADNTFPYVMISHVLHLVPNPSAILDEIARVVTSDGLFLHCFSRWTDVGDMAYIREAWQRHQPDHKRGGYNWSNTDSILHQSGWRVRAEPEFEYNAVSTPREFLNNVKNRVWSSTWEVSDEQLQPGINAIEAAIETHFDGDAETIVRQKRTFKIQICEPPA
jgi:ubiquinone/menaquinone biosynthesis C-methylase UbiE